MAAANLLKAFAVIALTAVASPAAAFVSPFPPEAVGFKSSRHHVVGNPSDCDANEALWHIHDHSTLVSHRRSFLHGLSTVVAMGSSVAVLSLPGVARAEAESMERGGVKLTPFNSLSFNYRGGSSPTTGTLEEPSISYSDFLSKLNSDQVTFVEFLAPNGNVAYATLKQSSADGEISSAAGPIRIGEGYPLEDPEGWSSPAFVIKAVAKMGVPYKFVVPGINASL
ncbi:hypothetical protein HJC23_012465 [Cyclotella cryptica]|uniref:Uncharacterized protein n=1 Tax=Cyclotella cryptica TaxID=29204 RepID=A0ABD3P4H8_9STRA|eukprot:CCRYP_017457-RA/>CCRYP_017457-RA protein AED:0.32 eAED:0.32 QI:171/1/1/1/1/1/3/1882/224